jgi:hypothetical protein
MKYTFDSVPDSKDWKFVDARTGLQPVGDDYVALEIDDAANTVEFQHRDTYEVTTVHAPMVVVSLGRKCVLLNYDPPGDGLAEAFADARTAKAGE